MSKRKTKQKTCLFDSNNSETNISNFKIWDCGAWMGVYIGLRWLRKMNSIWLWENGGGEATWVLVQPLLIEGEVELRVEGYKLWEHWGRSLQQDTWTSSVQPRLQENPSSGSRWKTHFWIHDHTWIHRSSMASQSTFSTSSLPQSSRTLLDQILWWSSGKYFSINYAHFFI